MKIKFTNILAFSITVTLVVALALLPSCERDEISIFSEVPTTVPSPITLLQWADLNDKLANIPNHFFIFSESILNSPQNPGYRIQGSYNDEAGIPMAIDAIQIGGITFPANENGLIASVVSDARNPDEFSHFKDLINVETSLYVMSNGDIIDEIKIRISPPLKASIFQDGNNPQRTLELDKTKNLVVTWPIEMESISFRNDNEDELELVGALIHYKPLTSASRNDLGISLPSESINISKIANYEAGEITFTMDDLENFPYYGIVTVYVGSVRYRVDIDGNLIVSSTGNSAVTTGGGQASILIRVIEP